MMKPWSDEWRCARLRLQLRDECLFQGETVAVEVCAEVPPVAASKAPNSKQEGPVHGESLTQRWRAHCETARVQIRLVDASVTDPHASSSRSSSPTLFRQETQFSLVSVDQAEGKPGAVVRMRALFDLKVRRESWDRPVLLAVHVTPRRSEGEGTGKEKLGSLSRSRELLGGSLQSEEWATSLLSLTREEAQPTPTMTRRVEQQVIVTKPLRLEVETRDLTAPRVGLLARVSNTHPTLSLAVRDLQLHLEQSPNASSSDARQLRIERSDKVPFPVELLPHERYNFLFVLEPVEVVVTDEAIESPELQHHAEALKHDASTGSSSVQKKSQASMAHRFSAPQQRCLLTLSWQAITVAMDPIVENRTVVWSPKMPTRPLSALSIETFPRDDMQALVASVLARQLKRGQNPVSDFRFEHLLPESVLQATIAPLPSSIVVGKTVNVCVTVANRSKRSEFDLTLVLPSQKEGRAPAFVSFEASHRLGCAIPLLSAL